MYHSPASEAIQEGFVIRRHSCLSVVMSVLMFHVMFCFFYGLLDCVISVVLHGFTYPAIATANLISK